MKLDVHHAGVAEHRTAEPTKPGKPGAPYIAVVSKRVLLVDDLQKAFSENPPDDVIRAIFAL